MVSRVDLLIPIGMQAALFGPLHALLILEIFEELP